MGVIVGVTVGGSVVGARVGTDVVGAMDGLLNAWDKILGATLGSEIGTKDGLLVDGVIGLGATLTSGGKVRATRIWGVAASSSLG